MKLSELLRLRKVEQIGFSSLHLNITVNFFSSQLISSFNLMGFWGFGVLGFWGVPRPPNSLPP